MKNTIALAISISILAAALGCTPYHTEGAGVGAAVGGVSGAIIDSKNPWRGGVIGGVLGAILGATIADVSQKASHEAAMSNRPVEYRTEDGRGVYRADPLGYNDQTRCRKVHERAWENDRLVKDRVREVCEGQRYEKRY